MYDGETLTVEHAEVRFKNFSGRATQFTPEGRRTFAVLLAEGIDADLLEMHGWPVKTHEFDGVERRWINVRVPNNDADYSSWDTETPIFTKLTIRGRPWEYLGRKGILPTWDPSESIVEDDS